jgi:hypothetical protein
LLRSKEANTAKPLKIAPNTGKGREMQTRNFITKIRNGSKRIRTLRTSSRFRITKMEDRWEATDSIDLFPKTSSKNKYKHSSSNKTKQLLNI